jgi:hypothetical protein
VKILTGPPVSITSLFYEEYCQAQPQNQLSWAELALLLISPAAHPSARPAGLVVKKQEISSTCFVTFVGFLEYNPKLFSNF